MPGKPIPRVAMSDNPTPPCLAAIIVAAGQGARAGQPVAKQFAQWRGKPVVRHSAEAFAAAGFAQILVAIPAGADRIATDALSGIPGVRLINGGASRQDTVRLALEALAQAAPDLVLIHDAARPGLTGTVIGRLITALGEHTGAIPTLPVVDSLTHSEGTFMGEPARREDLRRVQTPQGFRFAAIAAAHRLWQGPTNAGDDAQVARAAGLQVAMVEGDEVLRKLTFASDFPDDRPIVRVGTGFDVHRLCLGEGLWLCGVKIDHSHGLAGHSDADVAIHALVDAILGAIGEGDIGTHFPPGDPQWRGARSDQFLIHAARLAKAAGYRIGNIDLTIICEAPKIGPHRDAMRNRLAELLDTAVGAISIKATTTERLGFTGRAEGIAVQAVATLLRN